MEIDKEMGTQLCSIGIKIKKISNLDEISNSIISRLFLFLTKDQYGYFLKNNKGDHSFFYNLNDLFDGIIKFYQESVKEIHFYKKTDPFYEFTNFFESPFIFQDKKWKTSEHFFQAHKFKDELMIEEVRNLKTPREAFQYSRNHSNKIRDDWNDDSSGKSFKEDVMECCIKLKFSQNETLKQLLLVTKNMKLVEHTDNDNYWGDGYGIGKNRLGIILMRVRNEISNGK